MNKEEKEAIEIKKQYANGIVNVDEVIKSLIDKFKTDKTSVDIQQLQLMAEYLIHKADKLQKDNKELNLENQALYESINCNDDNMLARRYYGLQKENAKLQKENEVIKNILLDFIPQNIHEVELKTKILNIIRGDNND